MKTDDPKLTAYVLDELDAAERAEMEALLRQDPTSAEEARLTREFAGLVRRVLKDEPAPDLEQTRRAQVLAAATAPTAAIKSKTPRRARPYWISSAIAASLFLSAGYLYFYRPERLVTPSIPEYREEKSSAQVAPTALPETANKQDEAKDERAATDALAVTESMPAPPPAGAPQKGASPALLSDLSATLRANSSSAAAPSEVRRDRRSQPPASPIINAPVGSPPALQPQGLTFAKLKATAPQGAASGSGGAARETELVQELRRAEPLREEQPRTEAYDSLPENRFLSAREHPLSTFSADVDTASYANVRRFLRAHELPPKDAVRIEELLNYFAYQFPAPNPGEPFSIHTEVASCPWAPTHRLVRLGLQARQVTREQRPAANLVFLIDVSGSMQPANKLPLVKESLRLLVEQLGPQDSVAIAVYAGASGTVLDPTNDKGAIRAALEQLEAGGSTNGAAGIRLAYQLARRSFSADKTNRVLLATDGDFNVGTTGPRELTELITQEAKSGVFLTVLGFGYGNLKDATLEKLADHGNGNYAYIDNLTEGRKVLVEQMAGTLITVAKDVKLQVEFNPAQVGQYRLLGYENRLLAAEDFNDDRKDAGEIGAGHTVTALYEVVPPNLAPERLAIPPVDSLKYAPAQEHREAAETSTLSTPVRLAITPEVTGELLTLKVRWKEPLGEKSSLREVPLTDSGLDWDHASADFRWAAAVASFGMLLRDSPEKGTATWTTTEVLARGSRGEDAEGYRQEFLSLILKAAALSTGAENHNPAERE